LPSVVAESVGQSGHHRAILSLARRAGTRWDTERLCRTLSSRKPVGLRFIEAGEMPVVAATARSMLFDLAG